MKDKLYVLRCVEALTQAKAEQMGLADHVLSALVGDGLLVAKRRVKKRDADGVPILGSAFYSLTAKGNCFLADNGGSFPYAEAWRKGKAWRKKDKARRAGRDQKPLEIQ